jgi:RNA polymerase sigma factor (sigma-70 family)
LHLKNYIRSSFPSVRDVDDVVQESYLKIWQAKAAGPIKSAKAYLFTIARHLAINLVRRERIAPVNCVGDLASSIAYDDRPTPAEQISKQEKIELLGDALIALPPKLRAVIILYKFEGLSQAAIGRQLGLTQKAVEHLVQRGIEKVEAFMRSKGHDFF